MARDIGCTRDELGERMTNLEFVEWKAFYVWEAAMIKWARQQDHG
ncbi:MAG TPA: hypothetical protein VHL53_16025 [Acidimicrobiia bacterium]|nr:hypothetical protein [Acidimicrobiia bacterium]